MDVSRTTDELGKITLVKLKVLLTHVYTTWVSLNEDFDVKLLPISVRQTLLGKVLIRTLTLCLLWIVMITLSAVLRLSVGVVLVILLLSILLTLLVCLANIVHIALSY
jgi:hypothetical protein